MPLNHWKPSSDRDLSGTAGKGWIGGISVGSTIASSRVACLRRAGVRAGPKWGSAWGWLFRGSGCWPAVAARCRLAEVRVRAGSLRCGAGGSGCGSTRGLATD